MYQEFMGSKEFCNFDFKKKENSYLNSFKHGKDLKGFRTLQNVLKKKSQVKWKSILVGP